MDTGHTPGPSEEWFCNCRDEHGNTKLRPPTMSYCRACRASAPGAYVDPGDYRTWAWPVSGEVERP